MTPRGCNQWVARIHIRVRSTRSPAAAPEIEMELNVGTTPSILIPSLTYRLAELSIWATAPGDRALTCPGLLATP